MVNSRCFSKHTIRTSATFRGRNNHIWSNATGPFSSAGREFLFPTFPRTDLIARCGNILLNGSSTASRASASSKRGRSSFLSPNFPFPSRPSTALKAPTSATAPPTPIGGLENCHARSLTPTMRTSPAFLMNQDQDVYPFADNYTSQVPPRSRAPGLSKRSAIAPYIEASSRTRTLPVIPLSSPSPPMIILSYPRRSRHVPSF